MKAKLVGFDRRNNPQSRFSLPGLPKTTQLIPSSEFEAHVKKLAKSVSLPVDRALNIASKHPHEFVTDDVNSALFHKQLWDELHELREAQQETLLAGLTEKAKPKVKVLPLSKIIDLYQETIVHEFVPDRVSSINVTMKRFLEHFGDKKISEIAVDGEINLTSYRNKFLSVAGRSWNYLILEVAKIKAFTRHPSVKRHFSGLTFEWGDCSKQKKGKLPFTDTELDAITTHLEFKGKTNLIRFHQLALYTGFRREEVRSLLLKDIDLDAGRICIRKQKNKRVNQKFPVVPQLAEFLKQDLASRSSREVYFLDDGFGKIAWELGSSIRIAMSVIFEACGIEEGKTLHTYRHTFANRLLFKTRDIHKVSKALRHTTVTVTEAYLSNEIAELNLNDTLSDIEF